MITKTYMKELADKLPNSAEIKKAIIDTSPVWTKDEMRKLKTLCEGLYTSQARHFLDLLKTIEKEAVGESFGNVPSGVAI